MRKKLIFIFLIIFIILIFILIKIEYKGTNSGNNISKSDDTNILNISSYEANITVEVYSNKNTNKYIINQKCVNPNIFKQEVIEPNSMKGLTITADGEKVILENKLLDLKTLYENFKGDSSNLSLISFVNEYKEGTGSTKTETDNEILLQTKITSNQNKYQMYQNLYISKTTNLPTKMEILDINKNTTVYILYNEIKINKTSKNEVLG